MRNIHKMIKTSECNDMNDHFKSLNKLYLMSVLLISDQSLGSKLSGLSSVLTHFKAELMNGRLDLMVFFCFLFQSFCCSV